MKKSPAGPSDPPPGSEDSGAGPANGAGEPAPHSFGEAAGPAGAPQRDDVVLRRATETDDAALLAIDKQTWTDAVSPAPTPPEASAFFRDRTGPQDVLLAEAGGEVAGYVSLTQDLPIPSHTHVLTVNGLAVDPARQGNGIGRRLVEAAVAEAARRGARKVSLRVLAPNTTARTLYESCGFVVEGVLRGEFVLRGKPVDDLLMARVLD